MSERGIIAFVVLALLGVAFFFPYESSDDEYYRTHGKKAVVQKTQNVPGDADALHHSEAKGLVDNRLMPEEVVDAKPAEPGEPGARAADADESIVDEFAPLLDQVGVAEQQVAKKKGGFDPHRRLDGKYVQLTEASSTQPSASAPPPPSYIIFHRDGMFTEHSALSFNNNPRAHAPDDLSGHYSLNGYVLTINEIIPAFDTETRYDFPICSMHGDNSKGMPNSLFIDGKVFRYQED